ncbi:glutamine amidotransferase [Candidatus Saccharibacteria bacterium RIFCSPHIGHO2_01_FULL_45_15]|nr:MAG: glutamine amidotransferase [Candidatus Saccharibacteria bacterium RIFCSPHIGHO2_01_FULL_45_15]OGL27065.1 MAG: glutamine amidotransferase [Candidatus Saccharibacteria bacterium RIFCSPHIGHO2_02_FULL_46_12]OGL31875.1 MAG: glutamine amidotransferase [Candidatus Saccharibacteria bacterium RIFCSPHIGHO2_12_FULL_44_22]
MNKKPLNILQLYPQDMNIYGDHGNTLVISQRAKWHGYTPNLLTYNPGDIFPDTVDIIVGGGGQDSGQDKIQEDLLSIKERLSTLADNGTPMLMICGLYQLFGKFFKTQDGHIIQGIEILDIETHAGTERLIGNITTHSSQFGDIIGYENHSGQTFLGSSVRPLATIIKGAGNNGQDDTEGAVYKNVIGSYIHGSLLPKNPAIADFLIEQAAIAKFGEFTPTVIDDRFAELAREHALKRPR